MMAVLALRLQPALTSAIGEEQSGILAGRSIFNPILTVKALMSKHRNRKNGMTLFLDFEKAYDRLNPLTFGGCMERIGTPMG